MRKGMIRQTTRFMVASASPLVLTVLGVVIPRFPRFAFAHESGVLSGDFESSAPPESENPQSSIGF
jgi:hypothetical protein